jgi:hypothetical protein
MSSQTDIKKRIASKYMQSDSVEEDKCPDPQQNKSSDLNCLASLGMFHVKSLI